MDKSFISSQERLLERTQQLAKVGGWEVNLVTKDVQWTAEVYRIHELPLSFQPTVSTGIQFYAPEAQPVIQAAVERAIETGEGWDLELPLLSATGARKWVRAIGYPEREDGKTTRLWGIFQDLTQQKAAQEQIQHQQQSLGRLSQRLEIATSAAGIGIWYWEVENEELTWDSTMYGLFGLPDHASANALGFWQAGVHPEDLARVSAQLEAALAGEQSFDTTYCILWPDSTVHHLRSRATIERDAAGAVVRMIGASWDITTEVELQQREQHRISELENENLELSQFAYIASHDLQEPLRTISSYLKVLEPQLRQKLSETELRYVQHVEHSASRLQLLITDLLDYARLGRSSTLASTDLNVLLDAVLQDMRVLVEESKADLQIETLPQLTVYAAETARLFQNLVGNALKFRSAERPLEIRISASEEDTCWRFVVRDNGIGVPPKHAKKVFNVFQRLHSKSAYAGTGIGLSVCRKVVELHQGDIGVESDGSSGSEFWFTLAKQLDVVTQEDA